MDHAVPRLDHVVLDVRDQIEQAARVFSSLGFQLTERSRHTLGSVNHLAVFQDDYIELLGFDDKAPTIRADIASFPVGLNGLVFSTDRPDDLFRDLRANAVPALEPGSFSRPVNLPGGSADAKFRVVRLAAGSVSFGRVYFCHHLTPELVWRPEWQRHPNGALAIARVLIATRDPEASSEMLRGMFGPTALHAGPGGARILSAGTVEVELAAPGEMARRFRDAMPDPAGRTDYMAAVSFRTASISRPAKALNAGAIQYTRVNERRILVPASQAMNVALEFVE